MDMHSGKWICMDTLMDNSMDNAEIYDGWTSMYMTNGYLIRLRRDIHGYVWIQHMTIWICKWLVHGYTVWI